MSFWGNAKWREAQQISPLVEPFNEKRLGDGCYRLCVGDEAIISSSDPNSGGTYNRLNFIHPITLLPGQFAYIITAEKVFIPAHAIGFINVATATKIKGLSNISGFHVDPTYKGKLIFTVFNSGPSNITISRGDSLFRMWLSDFDPPNTEPSSTTSYDKIPREWIDNLHGVYPSPFALSNQLQKLDIRVKKIDAQKRQVALVVLVATILLAPFVAALYAETFGPYFHSKFDKYLQGNSQSLLKSAPPNASAISLFAGENARVTRRRRHTA